MPKGTCVKASGDQLGFGVAGVGVISKVAAQRNGNDPDPGDNVNVFDITLTIDAVKAQAFPFAGPNACL